MNETGWLEANRGACVQGWMCVCVSVDRQAFWMLSVMVHSIAIEEGRKRALALVAWWSLITWDSRISKEGGGRSGDGLRDERR